MKDEEIKFEETEDSHTRDAVGEVTMGGGRGEGVDGTLLSYTHRYINLTEVGRIYQVLVIGRVYLCTNVSGVVSDIRCILCLIFLFIINNR